MAFENGSATDMADLLSKLRSFISTNLAWTENNFDGTDLQVSNGDSYFNLHASSQLFTDTGLSNGDWDGIAATPSSGYNAGSAWDEQPGAPDDFHYVALGVFPNGDVPEYWFFTDDSSYVHVVAFCGAANSYTHLSFGDLNKIGTYTGGAYMAGGTVFSNGGADTIAFAEFDAGFIARADIDSNTDWWYGPKRPSIGGTRVQGRSPIGRSNDFDDLYTVLVSRANNHDGKAVLLPIFVAVERNDTNRFSISGTFPDVRTLNLGKATPGTSMTLGSDEWLLFPSPAQDIPESAGLAYKKVP